MNKNKLILSLAFIPLMFSSGMATVGLDATNEITDISTSAVENDLAAWGKSTDLNKLVPTEEDINQELKILTAYPYGSDLYLYFFYAHTDPKPVNGFGADISFDYPDDNYTTNFYSGGIIDTYDYGSYDFIKAKISNIYTSSKLNYYYFSKVYLRLAGDLKAFTASSYFNFKGSGEDLLYSNSDDKYCYINEAKVVGNITKESVYWVDEVIPGDSYYEDFYYFFNIDENLFDTIQEATFSYYFYDVDFWLKGGASINSISSDVEEKYIRNIGEKVLTETTTKTGSVTRKVKGNALFPLFSTYVDLDYLNIVDLNSYPSDINEYFKAFLDTYKSNFKYAIHVDPNNEDPLYRIEFAHGTSASPAAYGYSCKGHELSNVTPIKFVVTKDNVTFDLNVFAQPVDTTEGYVTVVKFPSFFDMYINALKDIWKTFLNVLKIVGISAVGLLVIYVAFKLVNFGNTVSTNRQLKKLNKKQKK